MGRKGAVGKIALVRQCGEASSACHHGLVIGAIHPTAESYFGLGGLQLDRGDVMLQSSR